MINDKITLKDLSFYTSGGGGVFRLIDHVTTQQGRDALRKHVQQPPEDCVQLQELQDAVRYWSVNAGKWPAIISNGTLVMLEKFFESADTASAPPSGITMVLGAMWQKVINRNEYFFTSFSVSHLSDFLKGCLELTGLLAEEQLPPMLQRELGLMADELKHRLTGQVTGITKETSYRELAQISYKARREMKHMVYRLMFHYARLDAWQSMAKATVLHNWVFPQLLPPQPVCFEAAQLSHPLLPSPVPYDINFNNRQHFLLLTGANMSGKTTFMRSLGVGALLAHLGMGVPAAAMRISFLQGIITNMHVEDDLLKGESYFFAEVKRMKHTAESIVRPEPHLVLMDELFKGTNVHDAYECTRAVIDGLLQHPDHLMVLSTHLYEVAQHFNDRPDIFFACFITDMTSDGGYRFSYELRPGISNDRIGYRILQREGVLDLLRRPGR